MEAAIGLLLIALGLGFIAFVAVIIWGVLFILYMGLVALGAGDTGDYEEEE